MLEAHGASGDPHGPIVEGANESIPLHAQGRLSILLWKSPQFATAIDRRTIIEEHGVAIATLLPIEPHRDDLAGLRVVTKSSRVGHANELVFDEQIVPSERLGNHGFERGRIRSIGDGQILPIDEAVRPRREGGARQRHGEGALGNLVNPHGLSFGSVSTPPAAPSNTAPAALHETYCAGTVFR